MNRGRGGVVRRWFGGDVCAPAFADHDREEQHESARTANTSESNVTPNSFSRSSETVPLSLQSYRACSSRVLEGANGVPSGQLAPISAIVLVYLAFIAWRACAGISLQARNAHCLGGG
jgi:hypothetical protein